MLKQMLVVCLIFIFGCEKKDDFVYDVSAEFEPYVQKFISEAKARGHSISINNLIIKYDATVPAMYCATSNVTSSQKDLQKIILVNPLKCWQNNAQLETLIFHELGHCILGRQHDTTLMPKGDPKTIMYPDDITLYSPCVYNLGNPCDFLYRRPYYIDELFNPLTEIPSWAK